jgi:hypothetical protein
MEVMKNQNFSQEPPCHGQFTSIFSQLAQCFPRSDDMSIEGELHVVGCHAPVGLPDYVKAMASYRKRIDREQKLLDELYQTAIFFVLRTLAGFVRQCWRKRVHTGFRFSQPLWAASQELGF